MLNKIIFILLIGSLPINKLNCQNHGLNDYEFNKEDTTLALNFKNFNNQNFSFYLNSANDYKFTIEKFTKEYMEAKLNNLVTANVDAIIKLKKIKSNNQSIHYKLLVDSKEQLNDFCFNLKHENNYWYGAPANPGVHFPTDANLNIKEQAYIPGKSLSPDSLGSVTEYVWFSSTGFLVFVERDVPLFISLQNGILCLKAKYNEYPYDSIPKENLAPFKAHIIVAKDVKKAHLYYLDNFVERPERSPHPSIYKRPIWTTWTRFKTNFDQNILLEWAKKISSNGFTKYGSIFEIDDKWEDHYGNFKFDKQRFPNLKQMVDEIKGLGFNTSIWLTPFFNPEVVENSLTPADHEFMVKERNSNEMLRLDWWQGKNATCLDFTNPKSRNWFTNRIKKLLNEYNIDTFKADAGEISWFVKPFKLYSKDADSAPNKYAEYYSLMIKNFETPLFIEMRSSFNSQKHGNVIRILDKESLWTYENGLQSIITSYLTYSLFGYPYILPDIVGGNDYVKKLDKELYLRWLAVNSLLPMVQYSMGPFDYGDDAVKIGLKFQELHNKYVPLFVELSENAKKTSQPIIRPLWWIDPQDEKTWTIDNQFLIGNSVLVAPILEQGKKTRNIYLPKGQWYDELKMMNITGPKILSDYKIELDEIAHFTKQ